jgi:hypothetical protein
MMYDRVSKQYSCVSCGLTLTFAELTAEWEKKRWAQTEEEKKERKRKEYLKWWVSPKKK